MRAATTFNLVLGQVVQQRRKDKALNQDKLAEALGITQSAYSRLERGVATFSFTQLLKVAAFFGVSVDRLVEEVVDTGKTLGRQGVHVMVESKVSDKPRWLWVSNDVLAHAVRANQKRGAEPNVKRR